jgi:hypothetical protein
MGQWEAGTAVLDRVCRPHPRHPALQVAHVMDFYRGDHLNLRNRVSRVLPAGHRRFRRIRSCSACTRSVSRSATSIRSGSGRAARAVARPEDCGRARGDARDGDAGPHRRGIAFLESRRPDWATPDNGFAFHNWWHLALFHLDRDEPGRALAIYDEVLAARRTTVGIAPRCHVAAVAPAARGRGGREALRRGGRRRERQLDAEAGSTRSNDFHAALAFAATGRANAIVRLRKTLESAAWEKGERRDDARRGPRPVRGAIAFGEERFDAAVAKLERCATSPRVSAAATRSATCSRSR